MMDRTLASRLSRIRAAAKAAPPPSPVRGPSAFAADWEELSPLVRRRVVPSAGQYRLPSELDPVLSILCPGSASAFPVGKSLGRERLLLFDLETTGLSGGAGTVAFLAAFARFESDCRSGEAVARLRLTQYLLLDYPGEPEFLEFVRSEFSSGSGNPVLVSYNGRSFDSQILRTRCLMNAMQPPDAPHLDLVYPARRFWKRSLASCSLAVVEREALGVDRGEDLPGSEAPDAWFDFLKRGTSDRLFRICDHNLRDLEGLAALLAKVEEIARDPLAAVMAGVRVPVDPEGLALRWLAAAKAKAKTGPTLADAGSAQDTARSLLEYAAAAGSPRAAYSLSLECASEGNLERAADLRTIVARHSGDGKFPPPSPGLRAASYRLLAVDAVRRMRRREAALAWVEEGLAVRDIPDGALRALARLRLRLEDRQ